MPYYPEPPPPERQRDDEQREEQCQPETDFGGRIGPTIRDVSVSNSALRRYPRSLCKTARPAESCPEDFDPSCGLARRDVLCVLLRHGA